jgi:hypothetical protein
MSHPMSCTTKRGWVVATAAAIVLSGAQLVPAVALGDPAVPPAPDTQPPSSEVAAVPESASAVGDFGPGPHNVIYKARVDGASRGATITYTIADDQVNTANPTMVPGRTFESTGVVSNPLKAGMQVSIQWPYSASLHCEIIADDQIIAHADQFVAPRLTPQRNDPGYGVLSCGSVTNFPTGNTAPMDARPPGEPAPPPVEEPAPPVM